MNTIRIIPIIYAALLISACKKTETPPVVPVADFIADKLDYVEGETIHLTNTSTNATIFKWTLPDGTTSNSKDLDFVIPRKGFERTENFRLDVTSQDGLKFDFAVKSAKITVPKGKMVVYHGYYSNPFTITIDGVSQGEFLLPADSWPVPNIPTCDQAGYPTFQLSEGSHTLSYYNSGTGAKTKTIVISANQCSIVWLD